MNDKDDNPSEQQVITITPFDFIKHKLFVIKHSGEYLEGYSLVHAQNEEQAIFKFHENSKYKFHDIKEIKMDEKNHFFEIFDGNY